MGTIRQDPGWQRDGMLYPWVADLPLFPQSACLIPAHAAATTRSTTMVILIIVEIVVKVAQVGVVMSKESSSPDEDVKNDESPRDGQRYPCSPGLTPEGLLDSRP